MSNVIDNATKFLNGDHEWVSGPIARALVKSLIEPRIVEAPIPMRLKCEVCGELHIDEGEYATNPHHTHSCQHCGCTWRPALVPTVGVRFLPGFKNEKLQWKILGEKEEISK